MIEGPEGPYVQVAAFCEKVLQEKDNVVSAIRLVDRFIATAQSPDPPEKMPPFAVNVTALVSLKAGVARGRYKVSLRGMKPSRLPMSPVVELPVHFDGGDNRGQNLIININFKAEEEGIYWFDVVFGDRVLTRMPLEILYQPIRTSQPRQ